MKRRHLLAGIALLTLTGCGPGVAVLVQANPNPFTNQTRFGVLPVDFSGLIVGDGTEAAYLADKDAETRGNWTGDKGGINAEFTHVLIDRAAQEGIAIVKATGPQDAPFMIRPHVDFIEPGIYAVVFNKPSEVRMNIRITAPDGAILDEIIIKSSTPANLTNPAVGNRLRDDGENLGAIAAEYLKARVKGEG